MRLVAPTKAIFCVPLYRKQSPSFHKATALSTSHQTEDSAMAKAAPVIQPALLDKPMTDWVWEDALWCLLLRKLKLRSSTLQCERQHLRTTLKVLWWLERIAWRTNIPWDRPKGLWQHCMGSKERKKNASCILKNVSSVLFSTLVNEIILEPVFISDTQHFAQTAQSNELTWVKRDSVQ